MKNQIKIGNRFVGINCPTFIVAEMSSNHNQSFQNAVEIIHAAKESGADAIKIQTYTPDTLTVNCENEHFRITGDSIWGGQTLYNLYQETFTPWEWQPKLKEEADKLGVILFSTPFDTTAVDFLNDMNIPAYKISSFELIDIPLIEYTAKQGKPVIISTGMGTLVEIEEAVQAVKQNNNQQLILLKCVSDYPARPEDMNLLTIPNLTEIFEVPSGLSDHTIGYEVAVAAVCLGACVIEKHLTLSRTKGGPDAAFSMEPHEFKSMVQAIRQIEQALGSVRYKPTDREIKNKVFRRSLFVVKDVKVGDKATNENVRSIRPGHGLPPKNLKDVIGKLFKKDTPKGTPVEWDLF